MFSLAPYFQSFRAPDIVMKRELEPGGIEPTLGLFPFSSLWVDIPILLQIHTSLVVLQLTTVFG